MKTFKAIAFLLLAALVMAFSPQRCLASLYNTAVAPSDYSDTITAAGGGLVGGDGWDSTNTTLSWVITDNTTYFTYSYTFTVPVGSPSHGIFEVSTLFELSDILGGSLPEEDPKWYETSGTSGDQPNMPNSIWGIKFDLPDEGTTETISFDSSRVPVWGNFYSKDGTPQGATVVATAWNTGLDPDYGDIIPTPLDVGQFVPVPDTVVPVPGAVLLGILGLGVAGLKLRKYA